MFKKRKKSKNESFPEFKQNGNQEYVPLQNENTIPMIVETPPEDVIKQNGGMGEEKKDKVNYIIV